MQIRQDIAKVFYDPPLPYPTPTNPFLPAIWSQPSATPIPATAKTKPEFTFQNHVYFAPASNPVPNASLWEPKIPPVPDVPKRQFRSFVDMGDMPYHVTPNPILNIATWEQRQLDPLPAVAKKGYPERTADGSYPFPIARNPSFNPALWEQRQFDANPPLIKKSYPELTVDWNYPFPLKKQPWWNAAAFEGPPTIPQHVKPALIVPTDLDVIIVPQTPSGFASWSHITMARPPILNHYQRVTQDEPMPWAAKNPSIPWAAWDHMEPVRAWITKPNKPQWIYPTEYQIPKTFSPDLWLASPVAPPIIGKTKPEYWWQNYTQFKPNLIPGFNPADWEQSPFYPVQPEKQNKRLAIPDVYIEPPYVPTRPELWLYPMDRPAPRKTFQFFAPLVPEGYTYVRPAVVPRVNAKSFLRNLSYRSTLLLSVGRMVGSQSYRVASEPLALTQRSEPNVPLQRGEPLSPQSPFPASLGGQRGTKLLKIEPL